MAGSWILVSINYVREILLRCPPNIAESTLSVCACLLNGSSDSGAAVVRLSYKRTRPSPMLHTVGPRSLLRPHAALTPALALRAPCISTLSPLRCEHDETGLSYPPSAARAYPAPRPALHGA